MSISSIASRTRMPLVWTRAPASRLASMTATLRPREAAVRAAARPAKPAPTMTRSNFIWPFSQQVREERKPRDCGQIRRQVAKPPPKLDFRRWGGGGRRLFAVERRDAQRRDAIAALPQNLESEAVKGESLAGFGDGAGLVNDQA